MDETVIIMAILSNSQAKVIATYVGYVKLGFALCSCGYNSPVFLKWTEMEGDEFPPKMNFWTLKTCT